MKHSKLSLALAGLIGVGAIAAADDVMAMSYHVQGDRIFLSGGVTYADTTPEELEKALRGILTRVLRQIELQEKQ